MKTGYWSLGFEQNKVTTQTHNLRFGVPNRKYDITVLHHFLQRLCNPRKLKQIKAVNKEKINRPSQLH